MLRELNELREAERLLREALDGLERIKGKQHPDTPTGQRPRLWRIAQAGCGQPLERAALPLTPLACDGFKMV